VFKVHIVRALGLQAAPNLALKFWWQALCGYHCAVDKKLGWKWYDWLPNVIHHYQLDGPLPGIGQLTPEDILELDAAFIKSGLLKFRRTSDVTEHLEFDPWDTDCICIYFDKQLDPGARGLIYRDNLIARSATKPLSGLADSIDSSICLSCMRRSTFPTVSYLVKTRADLAFFEIFLTFRLGQVGKEKPIIGL